MNEQTGGSAHMSEHPDVMELQQQYGQSLGSPPIVAGEGLLALVGIWAAVSPWAVGFNMSQPGLMANDLIIGLVAVVLGLGLSGRAERQSGLNWVGIPMGIWLILATWIVTSGGITAGIVVSQVITGAVMLLLGAGVSGSTLMSLNRKR